MDIGYAEDFTRPQIRRIAKGMLFTKDRAWRYEKEWRVVRPLDDADHIAKNDDEVVHLFTYPAAAVAEIIAGARARMELVEQLREVATDLEVPLYQTELSASSYRLRLARLDER